MTAKRILLIEDEPDIIRGLRDVLEFEHLEVSATGVGAEGIRLMETQPADCVILDLMLPDMNGFEVCAEIRKQHPLVPIIILTARGQESDKVRGLEAGADDYVTKPFSVAELLARIRAIFRRLQKTNTELTTFQIGDSQIDVKRHTLMRNRKEESLSFYEVELLKFLYERPNQPVSRDEILNKIWGVDAYPSNRTVDNFIVKLRKKIETNQKDPSHIVTVHGLGYKLVP